MEDVVTFQVENVTIKVGDICDSDEAATIAIEKWAESTFCPLTKVRYQASGIGKNGERIKGRRCWRCTHGIERKPRSTFQRTIQRIKFTACPVSVNTFEQEDGKWMITKAIIDTHVGHTVSATDYFNCQFG